MRNKVLYRGLEIKVTETRTNKWSATIYHDTRRLYTLVENNSEIDARNSAKGMIDWYFHDLVFRPDKLHETIYSKETTNNA